MITRTTESVTLWIDRGLPARLVWHGRRYRVSDEPTRLEDIVGAMHPLPIAGWRFQGTDDSGESKIFDIRPVATGWELLRVYD